MFFFLHAIGTWDRWIKCIFE